MEVVAAFGAVFFAVAIFKFPFYLTGSNISPAPYCLQYLHASPTFVFKRRDATLQIVVIAQLTSCLRHPFPDEHHGRLRVCAVLEKPDAVFELEIVRIALTLQAVVPGLDELKFQEIAQSAKKNCSLSIALGAVPEVTLQAKWASRLAGTAS
ncbi:MAG: hypothetical protein ABI606_00410 [Rhodoferax sp.]